MSKSKKLHVYIVIVFARRSEEIDRVFKVYWDRENAERCKEALKAKDIGYIGVIKKSICDRYV